MGDILAAVIKSEPDWASVPVDVPPAIHTLIRRCLTKDRRKRVADTSTLLYALQEASGESGREAGSSEDNTEAAVRARIDAAVASPRRALGRSFRWRIALVAAARPENPPTSNPAVHLTR